MKKMKNLLGSLMMSALMFTACQNDSCEQIDLPDSDQQENIEKIPAELLISLGNYSTYSSLETSPNTPLEIGEIKNVDIYVFSQEGIFYESMNLGLDPEGSYYKSKTFEFPVGNWYIYAFIHKPSDFMQEPTPGTTIQQFEQQCVTIGAYGSWTTRDVLIMGTLVRELKSVTGQQNPERIHLKVGHLLSKVEVTDGVPPIVGDLKGRFRNRPNTITGEETETVTFTVACEPKQIFLVGQWEGEYMGSLSQLISPHYESSDTTGLYRRPLYKYPSMSLGFWYTAENSNKVPNTENTTCFVVQYQYLPDPAEIHTLDHKTGGTLTNHRFYMAEFADGSRLIYESNPKDLVHPTLGIVKNVREHKDGYCYYRIPLTDYSKPTNTLRYSTIRNHNYVLTVNSISRIGNDKYDEWGEWEIPWEKDPDVNVNLEILEWNPYEIPVELE